MPNKSDYVKSMEDQITFLKGLVTNLMEKEKEGSSQVTNNYEEMKEKDNAITPTQITKMNKNDKNYLSPMNVRRRGTII